MNGQTYICYCRVAFVTEKIKTQNIDVQQNAKNDKTQTIYNLKPTWDTLYKEIWLLQTWLLQNKIIQDLNLPTTK